MPDPRCLYCDTPRPRGEVRCPECGHPWIDMTVAEAVERRAAAMAASVQPPAPMRPPDHTVVPEVQGVGRRRWAFPIAITAGAVAVYAIVFAILLDRTGNSPEPTVPVAAPTTTATIAPVTTQAAPATTAAPQPTVAPTTTEPPPPTTTTTTTPPIPALGDPIPLEELTLGAFALGPLEFGDADVNALGRLVATFGQPDSLVTIGEADGLCPTESGRAARFGWLTVLLRDEAGVEVLVGYRLEPSAQADHPTAGLRTISGAQLGDLLERWREIYSSFDVETTEIEGRPYLLLLRTSDQRTLLWGPLADEPQVVAGIFSPRPCDGGPFG